MRIFVDDVEVKDLKELEEIDDNWGWNNGNWGISCLVLTGVDVEKQIIYFGKSEFEC